MLVADCSSKFRRKQLSLLNDLVAFDDFIFGQQGPASDKFFVRRFYSHRDDLLSQLFKFINESDLDQSNELQIREFSIQVIFYLH